MQKTQDELQAQVKKNRVFHIEIDVDYLAKHSQFVILSFGKYFRKFAITTKWYQDFRILLKRNAFVTF